MPSAKHVAAAVTFLAGAGVAWEFWPNPDGTVGYPFGQGELGVQRQPLWELQPDEFRAAVQRDRVRVERAHHQLEQLLERTRDEELLDREDVETFSADERTRVRRLWWAFVEPLLELDEIKHRWEHWYGVDYIRHPELHARAYTITYASLSAQLNAGKALIDRVSGNDRIQRLFDEEMPDVGLPAGTFTEVRGKMNRARDQSFVLIGGAWYDRWIREHVEGSELATLIERVRPQVEEQIDTDSLVDTLGNSTEMLKRQAFERWFPLQREVATWFGDTRFEVPSRRLISDEQIEEMATHMRPGDIIVERRNWYLSNVGLPGFWPHAALFVGTHDDLRTLDADEAVQERFGGSFTEYLAREHSDAWNAIGETDHAGHAQRVVEAVSEGVVAASLEHSCGADYVGVLRPRLEPVEVASAIDRAFGYFGRAYDFDFDFATDDTVVCSELVMKAYEPQTPDGPGLRVPFIEVAGRTTIPPTEIVRVFAAEQGQDNAQLEFVWFLDGVEATHRAEVSTASNLAASATRPKWDILQR